MQSSLRKLEDSKILSTNITKENKIIKLLGFGNYNLKDKHISFDILFKNPDKINYLNPSLDLSIFVQNKTSTQNETIFIKCYEKEVNRFQEYKEYNCFFDSKFNSISIVKINNKFNTSDDFKINIIDSSNYNIEIEITPNAKKEMINIIGENKELLIFGVDEIKLEKDEFIIFGNMSKEFKDNDFLVGLTNKNLSFILINKTNNYKYKYEPKGYINEGLDEKIAISNNSKIFIFDKNNKFMIYPPYYNNSNTTPSSFVQIFDFGNYKESDNMNATGKVYIRGSINKLEELKKFMKFSATIKTSSSNLRNLDENKIQVIGIKDNTHINKGYITYDLDYKNTAGKKIISITPSNDYIFSDDEAFQPSQSYSIDIKTKLNYDLTNKGNIDFRELTYIENSIHSDETYGYFRFNFSNNDIILKQNDTRINLTYIPEFGNLSNTISCLINNESTYFTIKCSPKQSINTSLNEITIDITEIIKSQSKNLRILQATNNDKINAGFPPSINEFIKYDYIPKYNPNRNIQSSSGLSGGAIAAIVIASVVAISAVGIAILFANKASSKIVPPKAIKDSKIENSSSNINE